MPARRQSAALGLALIVLLLGCTSCAASTKATPGPSGSASPKVGLDAGWTMHADNAGGFAVAFPGSWVEAMRDSPTLADDLATINVQQPDLGRFFISALDSSKTTGLVLLAADPSALASGFTTNAAVFRVDLGTPDRAPDLDAITRAKVAALGKDSTITGAIDHRHVRMRGQDASRIAYVFKSGSQSVEVASYLLLVDRGKSRLEYELTIGSAMADYAQLFAKIAASFALSPAKTLPTPSPRVSLNPNGPGPPTKSP
jgi:hypothetical protein